MNPRFFEQPILNSPYEYPSRHWELDADGQPTERVLPERRPVAAFVSAIPKTKRRQREMVFAVEGRPRPAAGPRACAADEGD